MTNNTQIRTRRISFVLALSVITYATISTYLYTYHEINTVRVMIPIILGIGVTVPSCGLLQRFLYKWLTKNPIHFSLGGQSSPVTESDNTIEVVCTDETQSTEQSIVSHLDNYDAILGEFKKKETARQIEIMDTIREYVTIKTAPYLSKETLATLISNIEYMACNQPDLYKPLRSNMDNPLKLPGLRHLAWNIGERLGISLPQRAAFIKASFPHELTNATLEYLKLNLRDNIPSQIPIDVPDKGDFHFHSDTDNDNSQ